MSPSKNTARLGVVLVVLLLLTPISFTALTNDTAAVSQNSELRKTATNVTFISTQGGSTHIYEHAGALVAVHTDSKQILWKHDAYRRYMDIDPIGDDRILFVAGEQIGKNAFRRVVVVANWRTGEELVKFKVPPDAHDVDYLGNDRYAVADKRNDRAYVYNATTKEIVWEYDFEKHFSPNVGGPEKDYTHLNDIDSVDNGSAFLLSPRNFDRVMLVDRESKQIEWTLGSEDDYDILYEQHNPVLLERNPPTVLVSDSENHRIVEYRRQDGDWKRTWVYSGHLHWPRDADRLPNGNTLIADSLNDRVLEVTPDRKVVWQFHIERGTYDVERLRYGDEPAGPTMASQGHEYDEPDTRSGSAAATWNVLFKLDSSYRKTFQILTWVLPGWITLKEYGFLLSATLLFVGWMFTEAVGLIPDRRIGDGNPCNAHCAT
ncbi:aryl-sulfate sulfotransferase [Haladaptatus sp. NG-SE-30]